MIESIVVAVVALGLAFLLLVSTRPGMLHVERTVSIAAPAESIFPLLNDFRQWRLWTPYDKDPAMQKTYSGNESGEGAHYAWSGNKSVGQGEIAIVESRAPGRLLMDLHMIRPFEARNVATFTLAPETRATRVTWALDAPQNFMSRLVSLFMNMDRMIGQDFEIGLGNLKRVVESRAQR